MHPSSLLFVLANERPLINIDSTLWIDLALWLLLFVVLKPVLFDPMLRLIAAREAGTEGSRQDARRLEQEARAMESDYKTRIKAERSSASAEREKLRAEGARREAEILAEARTKMNAAIEAQRATIRTQRETLEAEIRGQVPALASDIATRVLGREVRAS